MMVRYLLKHKDDIAAEILFCEEDGSLHQVLSSACEKYLPVCARHGHEKNLAFWWRNRAVPKSRSDVRELLDKEGVRTTQSLLLNNLGLSMTDSFWVCPADSQLRWQDVSFHLNARGRKEIDISTGEWSPNRNLTPIASTGGELKKVWSIADGQILLVKGNVSGYYFQQSLNEVLATMVHRRQGYTNHVPYHLIQLNDGSTACACPCFTDEHTELIPAWEVFAEHAGEAFEGSLLDAFAQYASEDGFDRNQVRRHLDYMFTVDYILSNTDRHTNNFGLLRNSDTLEPIGPAPIYDTGNSMFHLGGGIGSFLDLFHLSVSSLYDTDGELMDKVEDPSLVDTSRLPCQDDVVPLLSKDPVVAPSAQRLWSYMAFKANVVKARQEGLDMLHIEDGISLYLDEDEKKDINKGWARFWHSLASL